MPRPKKKVDTKKEIAKTVDKNKKIACFSCNNLKVKNDFYMSYNNSIHKNGRVPYCKECIQDMICDSNGNVDIEKVKKTLQLIDRPFLYDIFKISMESGGNVMGKYIKNIAMQQYKDLTWKDSIFLPESDKKPNYDNIEEVMSETSESKSIKEDLRIKWGNSYDLIKIARLENFYNEMITTHFITTPQHRQILKFICKLNLKMDECLESDDLGNFTKLSQQYDKLLQTSGLRPIDKTSSNVDIGIKNFSTIFEEVEKDGFIKPAPIEENQDIIDRTIMYIMNYTLKLLNANQFTSPPLDTPKMHEVIEDG